MMKKLLFCIFLLSSVALSARDIYVVSVGICDYKYSNDLMKTENDARDMAELYRKHTSHVKLLLGSQATHDTILSTLKTFFAQAKEEDIVVFFFSGHGSSNGLVAYDTRNNQTLVTYAEVQEAIRSCKANNKQLYIDACHAGGLRSGATNSAVKAQSFLSNTEGVMLFLSSRTQEISRENLNADNGFFTQYLLLGMKGGADENGDRIVTAKELYIYVSTHVSKRTKNKQNPVMWGKFNDDMHVMNWNPKQ